MKLLFDEVCASCPIAELRGTPMPINPKWHVKNPLKYLFIGEVPREDDEKSGVPFSGPAGKLFIDCMKKAEVLVEESIFSNTCWCPKLIHGKNRYPEPEEYAHCMPHSLDLIRRYTPKLVIAVGKGALAAIVRPKNELKVTKQHGKFFEMKISPRDRYLVYLSWVNDMEGYLDETPRLKVRHKKVEEQDAQIQLAMEKGYNENWTRIPVMPVIAPGYCIRQGKEGKWTESIIFDLQTAAVKVDEEAIHARVDKDYYWINDEKEALDHLDMLIAKFEKDREPIACDIETSEELGEAEKVGLIPLDPRCRILTIQLTYENDQGACFMINHRESVFNDPAKFASLRNKFKEFFEKVDVVGHNFQFDSKAIRCRFGIDSFRLVGDTMLMFHWLQAGKGLGLGLDDLGARLLGTGLHKRESHEWRERNPEGTFEDMPLSLALDYASGDTDVTYQAYNILKKDIEKEGRWQKYFDHHHGVHAVWDVIADLEWYGMPIDKKVLDELSVSYPIRIDKCLRGLHHNPFIRAYLEEKRKQFNSKIADENAEKVKANIELVKWNEWLDGERAKGRKPTMEKKDKKTGDTMVVSARKVPLKKPKEGIDNLNDWVDLKKRWFNPNSVPQVVDLWKNTAKFPWESIVDLEYGDIDPKKGKYSKKKFGDKPKTNKHNRKVLIDWANGNITRFGNQKNDGAVKYYECLTEMLKGIEQFKRLDKNNSSYVKGIYPLVIDPVEPDQPWDPKERCFNLYSPYSNFPRPWTLHPSFHLAGAETGRLSSSDPNGQAFPKTMLDKEGNVKLPYVSHWQGLGGILVQPDYSQLEVRVLVMFAMEALMAAAINAGEDVHRFVSSLVNGCKSDQVTKEQRAAAKTVTFGIIYGQGLPAMAQILGISKEEAQRIQDDVFARVPNLKKYIDARHQEVRETGRVENVMGRVCYLPHIESDYPGEEKKALRNSVNAPIQGAGSDLCAQAFGRAWKTFKREKIKAVPFNVCHDSQTFDSAPGYFFDVIEAQYYEMVWAQYTYYDWMNCKPEADFDLGASWGRLVSADFVWDDDSKVNYDHNRLVLTGEHEDIEMLVQEIRNGGQTVKYERDALHHQKEEAEKGKWESHIWVDRPSPIVHVIDKKLIRIAS